MKEWFEGKTVAIIGNATSLFDKKHGAMINSAEVVCRLNKGIILIDGRSEETAGSKVDVWAFNLYNHITVQTERSLPHNEFLKLQMNETDDKEGYDGFYPKAMLSDLEQVFRPKKPSTGIRLIDYVLKSNPKHIQIHGFDWKKTPTFYSKNANNSQHNFQKERLYCAKLISNNGSLFTVF